MENIDDPKIIYQDEEVLVVVKPPAMTTTNEGTDKEKTLENWLKENIKSQSQIGRGGIVHRLDKGTSGLLVAAKTEDSLMNLRRQFKNRTVKKKYIALVSGDLPYEGEIKAPIKRSRFFGRWQVHEDGKPADSCFKTLKKLTKDGKVYSLVEVSLKSGRTHQIRVHFKYLKWPLVGDKVYGGEVVEGLDRPFLHARSLGFTQPKSGQWLEFCEELWPDLLKVLQAYVEKVRI